MITLLLLACQEFTVQDLPEALGSLDNPADLNLSPQEDVVIQRPQTQVDILWVIDNSGSMSEEQDEITTNLDAFMQFFVGSTIDFHIGVITTDTENSFQNGILNKVAGYPWLSADVPLLLDVGRIMLTVGTGGSAEEKGLDATWRALTMPSAEHVAVNGGFLRPGAGLHIVAVSDEEDSSEISTYELASYLTTLKASPQTPVTFSSIVGDSPGGCVTASTSAAPGSRYISVSQQVGGIIESICVDDWGAVLEGLGLLAAGMRREFFLSQVPAPGTLEVWVQLHRRRVEGLDLDLLAEEPLEDACARLGHDDCFGYRFDPYRNSIFLPGWLPPPQARLHLRYERVADLYVDPIGP